MKKVIITNLILTLLIICAKVWNYISLGNLIKYYTESGIGISMLRTDFFNLYVYKSKDAAIAFTDFSIYVLIIGLLTNLFFLYNSVRKNK
jgi:SUMO ligase MMS21 Smc5/6 complex component